MPDENGAARKLLSDFQRLQSGAARIGGTGDGSLDLILAGLGHERSKWLRQIAVPHWFNETLLRSIVPSSSEASDFLSEVAAMPWIRTHPLGLVLHDEIRGRLRNSLLEFDRGLFRETCKQLCNALPEVPDGHATDIAKSPRDDEVRNERIYLMLAFDEKNGFERLHAQISGARATRLINVTDGLVHIAEEQWPLLSAGGRSQVELYRGLLLLDLKAWDQAIDVFSKLDLDRLEVGFRVQALLSHGMALEGCGRWADAKEFYLGLAKRASLPSSEQDLASWAKIHQRLAEVFFALRDLKHAERHCKRSLQLNRKADDQRGEAINLRLLGAIFEKLHDTANADESLMRSLTLFRTWGNEEDKARVYSALGSVSLNAAQWQQARDAYEEEQQIRVASMDNYGLAFVYANLGKLVMAESANVDEALRYFAASIELLRQFRDPLNLARVLRNRSLVLESDRRYPEALDALSEAYTLLPEGSSLKVAYGKEVRRLDRRQE